MRNVSKDGAMDSRACEQDKLVCRRGPSLPAHTPSCTFERSLLTVRTEELKTARKLYQIEYVLENLLVTDACNPRIYRETGKFKVSLIFILHSRPARCTK